MQLHEEAAVGDDDVKVLLAGNTRYVTREWIEQAFPDGQVVVLGDRPVGLSKRISVVSLLPEQQVKALDKLFETYAFGRVVWFSPQLTPGESSFEAAGFLQSLLNCCGKGTQVLCLEGRAVQPDGKIDFFSEICAKLCDGAAAQVQRVLLPWLYDAAAKGDFLARAFQAMQDKEPYFWAVSSDSPVCFLAMDDLAELVRRLFENWRVYGAALAVPDCFGLTMGQLSERVHALWPDAPQPAFSQIRLKAADCRADVLRRETMWFPRYSIIDDLPAQKQAWEAGRGDAPRRESLRARLMRRRRLVQTLELLLGGAAAELLIWATGAQVQFRMIDFRLLLIVLMGTMYGMQWGIAAAGLESIFLAHAYSTQNVNWLTLFYEPTNWVAFIAYFTVGAVCGYVRGKSRDDLQFARQEGENVRKKFAFLRQIYQDAVRGNQELRRQIISSQDSFGKIFRVTQQLDVTEPREVFFKAVKVLGELLENESIAIYSVGKNKGFARLEASSRAIMRSVPQSLRMQSLEPALAALEKGEVWVNTQFLPDMPAYLACARENGETVLLIEIVQAKYEQMTLYYQNLFKVLCGLIQASLLRALQTQAVLRERQCVPGTYRLLKPEVFRRAVDTAKRMEQEHVARSQLLCLEGEGRTPEEMDVALAGKIRENDEAGYLEDGNVWLLLSQATPETLPIVCRRLEGAGFRVLVKERLDV